jgi:hypothetical protein
MKIIACLLLGLSAMTSHCFAADLTFKNTSLRSISLEIPGVMNPNLNPLSTSGVSLSAGQKVFFKYKGKRELLLVITSQKNGDVIIINDLISKRRNEIDKK